VDLDDLDQASGTILIRKGKGSKPREIYLGRLSKQILRKYLKHRADDSQALWVTLWKYLEKGTLPEGACLKPA